MTNLPFDAVIFDLDGVIADTAHFHFLAWREFAAELGIAIDESFNGKLKGLERMASLETILAYGKVTMTEAAKRELCERKNFRYRELLTGMSPRHLLPGVLAVLDLLQRCEVTCALASSSRNASFILDALQLRHRFTFIADPAEVARGKPAPDIFLLAAQGLGAAPSDCLGIEDSVAGLQAIRSAGMRALGVGGKELEPFADVVIPDLRDFRRALRQL